MRITFTGDILCYKSQDKASMVGKGTYDYNPVFEEIKPLFAHSDYIVGSFETTLAGKESGYTSADISFNTPDEFLRALKDTGFNLLTTANNHCFDRGLLGLERTMRQIQKEGLEYTGTRLLAEDPPYLIKTLNDTRIAFLAYTYGTNSMLNGVMIPKGREYLVNLTRPQDPIIHRPLWKQIAKAILSPLLRSHNKAGIVGDCVSVAELNEGRNADYESAMINMVKQAKNDADIVIMCLHSGGQFNSKVGAYTEHLFDILANSGVDAIICNHPHTMLPIYKHGNCLIASALGNLSFAPGEGYWVEGVKAEYSALLHIEVEDHHITGFKVDVCKCVNNGNGLAITVPANESDEDYNVVLERLRIDEYDN